VNRERATSKGTPFAQTLAVGLALVLLTSSGAALLTFLLANARARQEVEARSYFDNVIVAERLHGEVEQIVAASRGYLLSGVPRFTERMAEAERAADKLLDRLAQQPNTPSALTLLREIKEAYVLYNQALAAAVRHRHENDAPGELSTLLEQELQPRRQQMDRLLDSFVGEQQTRLEERSHRLKRQQARFVYLGVGSLSLGILVSVMLAVGLGRHLNAIHRREQAAMARAEHAAAAREELLAIVAHDLRSPLTAIRLRAARLRNRSPADDARVQGEGLERLARRMDILVKTLLDTASVEHGGLSLQPAACAVEPVLAELMDLFAGTAEAASVHLETAPVIGDLRMLADRDRIIQVLSNLVGNAIKFARPEDHVDISAVRDQQGMIRFQVADSGPGIPPDQLERVFHRFWKSDAGGNSGAGLGLYIARQVVEAHGGRIWAERGQREGTSFTFTLPEARADVQAQIEPHGSSTQDRELHAS
jgi:signal transduction histidine kinase